MSEAVPQKSGSGKVIAIIVAAVILVFLLFCGGILAALIIPAIHAAQSEASATADFSTVKGFSNAFTMYHKKYQYFPSMTDMSKDPSVQNARAKGHAVSLKLLLKVGIVEDPKAYFSPREPAPSLATLDALMTNLDPHVDPTFYTSYAYDPGHNVNHGSSIFFGNRKSWLDANPGAAGHFLTSEMTGKKIDGMYIQRNGDDIFKDEFATYGDRDSYLKNETGTGP